MPGNPLDNLRDIHLPAAVSWWPPAPGWWIVAGFALLALGWLAWRLYRRHARQAFKRQALRELRGLREALAGGQAPDAGELCRELSILLRRVALAAHPPEQVAGLHGEAWLSFLDQGGVRFSQGVGRILAEGPYRRPLPGSLQINIGDEAHRLEALLNLAEQWIKRQ
jgi:hypothetical protein